MLRPWTRYILYVFTLPTDLIGWLVMLFVARVWGSGWPQWSDGALTAVMRADSWPMRTWYKQWGGTTIGHAIMLAPMMAPSVVTHERVHVEQAEANALCAAAVGLTLIGSSWVAALLVWITLPWCIYAAATLCAILRGENGYRGNYLEEAAYDRANESTR